MKKSTTRNLMLLGMTAFSLTAAAQQRQVNLEIHIDEPANGTVFQPGQTFPFTVSITNHGPDELVAGDSLFVITPSGEPTWGTLQEGIPVDSNFVLFSNELTVPSVESTGNMDLCVQLVDDPTTQITLSGSPISVSYIDPIPDNNVVCHTITIEATPSSISKHNIKSNALEVYPNPAGQLVHIPVNKTSKEAIMIQIRDISGKTVLSEHFSSNGHETVNMNVGQLQEGIYIIESQQGNMRSTGKLSIMR